MTILHPYTPHLAILLLIVSLNCGCKKNSDEQPPSPHGKITFQFSHLVDDQPLVKNQLVYTNAAGNQYLVTDVMYFISDITLHRHDGKTRMIRDWQDIFYINEAIPSTIVYPFFDEIEPGAYDSITFVFGITGEKNKSFMYVNPPEVLMSWPAILGGGYHYMMINGKWKDPNETVMPFNLHLGIGQLYKGNTYNTDSIYAYVQNWFTVSLPGSSFILNDGDSVTFSLAMHIDRWFDTPHVFDFNYWGGDIMQKQPAMQVVKENGADVFTIQSITIE